MGLLIQWILSAIALLLVSRIVPGFHVMGLLPALIASVVIGLLNATVGFYSGARPGGEHDLILAVRSRYPFPPVRE